MELIITAVQAIIKLMIIGLAGFILSKRGVFNKERTSAMSTLLTDLALPMMIIGLCIREYTPEKAKGLVLAFLAGMFSQVLAIIVSSIVIRKKDNPDWAIERFSSAVSNPGFLGIPIINLVLGSEASFYTAGVVISCCLISWTYGLFVIKGNIQGRDMLKALLNPGVLSIIVGVLIYFLRVPVPTLIADPIVTLGNMAPPLSMLIAGSTLASADLGEALRKKNLYVGNVIRLFVAPLSTIIFFKLFNVPELIATSCFIALSTGTVTLCMALSIKYDRHPTYASAFFAISTLLCMFTIPVVLAVYTALM